MTDQTDLLLPLVTMIVPVFNEEKNIRLAYDAIVEQFDKLKRKYRVEILFSDNHSTDGTETELKQLASEDPRVKVVRLARNFGFQKSVLNAYRTASGACAIQIDCDLQDPPEIIPLLLEKWDAGHDVVVGIRRKRQESMAMNVGRRLFYKLVSAISDDNIVENAGDFRLIDRSVIDQLKIINDARPYTRGLVSSLAARQTGVEFDRNARLHEKSKFPLRRLTGFATDGIVSHSLVPLRLATFSGIAIFMVAVLVALYYLINFLIIGDTQPEGFATLVILLLASIGVNAIFIGIVGEYVGRIYDQVRVRPTAIVQNTINLEANAQDKTKKVES